MTMDSVPRINLDDYRNGGAQTRQAFVKTLGTGLIDLGFVNVAGHGLNPEMIHDAYQSYVDFFNLDRETKEAYNRVKGGQRGYTPFGREQAVGAKVPDLKEFWHVGQELSQGHPYRSDYPDNIWPDEVPELKSNALALYRGLESVAETLLEALADYFELPRRTFADMMKDGDSILRTIHYPPLRDGDHPNAVRAAAHQDINLITLLIESKGQGLELLTREGNWLPVNALQGDIVVDSGDMLSRITNEVIPATTHRVVNPPEGKNESRYSMPFFVHPFGSCDLSVLERFVSAERPAKFPPITARGFLTQRLKEIGLL